LSGTASGPAGVLGVVSGLSAGTPSLCRVDLRRAVDGWHGIWQVDRVAHQFWLPQVVPDAAAFYTASLPMHFFVELRAHATSRFWRALSGRPAGRDFRALPVQVMHGIKMMRGG
jgi:hypothetical protein